MRNWVLSICLLFCTIALPAQEPFRTEATAFGKAVIIRAVGPDWGLLDREISSSLEYLASLEEELDNQGGGLATLNEQAAREPRIVSVALFDLLQRASWYCRWSDGRHGPLGAWLYASWGLRQPVVARPGDTGLSQRSNLANCENLQLDAARREIRLTPTARLDLWGFERGFAVDRLLDRLVENGIDNVTVSIGNVQRGLGLGPRGEGWSLSVALPSELSDLYEKVHLVDESLAIASPAAARMIMGGVTFAPYLDQRTGKPTEGVAAALAVTETAVDAEALASTTFITGNRVGSHLVAQLQPRPSILWWLGSGQGKGLLTDYNWSRVLRPKAR